MKGGLNCNLIIVIVLAKIIIIIIIKFLFVQYLTNQIGVQ